MSQITFVNLLGDALERAIASETAPEREAAHRRRWPQLPSGRGRLILALAALVLAGGALATTLHSPTRLAAGGVSCSEGTSNHSPGLEGVPLSGLSPIAACLREYRRLGATALTARGTRFIACQQPGFMVDVMVADGRPKQCRRLGLLELPPGYSQASSRVALLERSLGHLQRGRDCIAPSVLASEIRRLLARLGFVGWKPELEPSAPVESSGPCAQFPGSDTQPSDPYLALDPTHRVVLIGGGPPLSVQRLRDRVEPRLILESGSRCLSLHHAKTLARTALSHRGWVVRFALTRELLGQQFDPPRQRRYESGCTVVVTVLAAAARRTMDVWLNTRSAPALARGEATPSPAAYRR